MQWSEKERFSAVFILLDWYTSLVPSAKAAFSGADLCYHRNLRMKTSHCMNISRQNEFYYLPLNQSLELKDFI